MLQAGVTDEQLGRLADLRRRAQGGACADDGPVGSADGVDGVDGVPRP
jgi:hypothetical protein